MKVIDVLRVMDEYDNVAIKDEVGKVISIYDGKNSIDESYNELEIIEMSIELIEELHMMQALTLYVQTE